MKFEKIQQQIELILSAYEKESVSSLIIVICVNNNITNTWIEYFCECILNWFLNWVSFQIFSYFIFESYKMGEECIMFSSILMNSHSDWGSLYWVPAWRIQYTWPAWNLCQEWNTIHHSTISGKAQERISIAIWIWRCLFVWK